jgi:hypothetical protein
VEPFLNGDGPQAIIPIEATKERPVFHLIPWNLKVEILLKGLERLAEGAELPTTQPPEETPPEIPPMPV